MARATRKNKEATEIVEENVSKKPKVDRKKRKNDEDNHDDMTELARERHAEWAKLVLGVTYFITHLSIHIFNLFTGLLANSFNHFLN